MGRMTGFELLTLGHTITLPTELHSPNDELIYSIQHEGQAFLMT
jgi:hypothetical protein